MTPEERSLRHDWAMQLAAAFLIEPDRRKVRAKQRAELDALLRELPASKRQTAPASAITIAAGPRDVPREQQWDLAIGDGWDVGQG